MNLLNKNEDKILAYAFSNVDYLETVVNAVNVDYFTADSKRTVFQLLKFYYKKFNGIITKEFVDNLFKQEKADSNDVSCFILEQQNAIMTKTVDNADLLATIEFLKSDKLSKMKFNLAQKIANDKNADITKDMRQILEFQSQQSNYKNTCINYTDTDKRYEAYTNKDLMTDLVKTNYNTIDKAIVGMKKGELTYIIGRKGAGKSIFMLNLGYNFWKQEQNVLFFTLEISKEDYARRLDSLVTNIPSWKMKSGEFNEIEAMILKQKLDNMKNNIDDNGIKHTSRLDIVEINAGCNVNTIKSKVKELEKNYNIKYDAVIIDYAGIMMPSIPQKDDRLKHGQIAFDLKNFARDNSYILISGAQMNREGEKSDTSSSAHVANSDAVSDHIDYGFAIKLDKDINSNFGIIESFKTRDGSPFRMDFIKKFETFKIEESAENALWDSIGGAENVVN